MTREDINDIINVICPNDEDYEKPCISPKYLRQELEQLALDQKQWNEESTTKNNLEVDAISRADAIRVASGYCHPSNIAKELMKLPPVNVITLPDDATNGDAILAVFPDTEYYRNNGIINTDIDDGTLFDEDWWEAPYKAKSEPQESEG